MGFGGGSHFFFVSNFLQLHTVQNWITHHPNPTSGTSLGGSLGGSACNGFHIGLMKLILFAKSVQARNWNYIVNQRKKGVSRNAGVKYL